VAPDCPINLNARACHGKQQNIGDQHKDEEIRREAKGSTG
jgi:hypothetical protein